LQVVFCEAAFFSKYAANFIPIVVANPKIVPMKPKTAPVEKPRQDEFVVPEKANIP
jgi:hypothetical protein